MADTAVVTWDTPQASKILIYSIATTDLLFRHEPNYNNYGIKSLNLSKYDEIMAAGMYDGSIILYNNLLNQEIASLQHLNQIDLNQKSAKTIYVYQEEVVPGPKTSY